jgi:hypothetical protein
VGESGADFVDVGAVDADGFVQNLAGDVELFRPVGNVGGDFGVDLFGIAGALGVLFVGSVGLVGFGCIVVLGHAGFLFPVGLVSWMGMGRCTGRVDWVSMENIERTHSRVPHPRQPHRHGWGPAPKARRHLSLGQRPRYANPTNSEG